jgi:PKD domain
MKRKVLVLLVILLAATTLGARRRSVGGTRGCAALTASNLSVRYTGALSGCATGNATQCQIGEAITFDLSTLAYDTSCGEHQIVMRFGDARSDTRTATGKLPSFSHAYATAGGYAVEATVSNGSSSAKLSQMVMVKAEDDDDGIY